MGYEIDRLNGQNFSDNVLDPILSFDSTATNFSVSSGTGTGAIITDIAFNGNTCLFLQNTDPTNDLVVTQTTQNTIIRNNGDYGISLYLRKIDAEEFMTLELKVFKNAVLFDTQTMVIGSEDADEDKNDIWVRFDAFTDYNFFKDDEITFTWNLKGKVGTALLNTNLYIDGMMLYKKERQNIIPPNYVPPVFNRTLGTSNVVLENLTIDQLNLSVLNTAPLSASDTGTVGEIRITATHIYVCSATDTWVRCDLATW